jgi:glycosyltransferase involved in cell wall biosynthesis
VKILLIVPNIVSFDSFLLELAAVLAENGHDVHCACNLKPAWENNRCVKNGQVVMHHLPFVRGLNLIDRLANSLRLNRLLASLNPDIVHAHFSSAIFTTALAHRDRWPSTIGTYQGVGFLLMDGLRSRLLKKAETWASSQLDAVWVLTEDDYQGLRELAPQANINKQSSLGFGCDLRRFDPEKIQVEQCKRLREQLGLTSRDTVFAFIGRQVQFKGFDLTVRAFLQVIETHPNAHLLLIGKTDPLHPTGLTAREKQIMNRSSKIIDVGWQSQVQNYLSFTQVVVFPSKREGVPVSLMEALAMGVPVITRDSRGCRDVVRDGIDGLVLQDCTVDHLSEAMQLLACNKPLRDSFSENALAGRERFDRFNYVREQIDIYQYVLSTF